VRSFRFEEKVILFCDIHNFSKIMAKIGSRYPTFVQSYYSTIGEEIVEGGGRIVKYMGDAILAVFERGSENQAVICADRMRSSYVQMLKKQQVRVASELEVGINGGRVGCGEFGHHSLQTFDVFGPAVNEAAMIMHHRGIAVTEKVRTRLDPGINVRKLPGKKLKWQKSPLEIWEVVTASLPQQVHHVGPDL
jgi:adenylate cyclase